MTYSFARVDAALSRAASAGVVEAAESLAQTLRNGGVTAVASGGPVTLEGAGLAAREFGTRVRPPRPALGPALRANHASIQGIVARHVGGALK